MSENAVESMFEVENHSEFEPEEVGGVSQISCKFDGFRFVSSSEYQKRSAENGIRLIRGGIGEMGKFLVASAFVERSVI